MFTQKAGWNSKLFLVETNKYTKCLKVHLLLGLNSRLAGAKKPAQKLKLLITHCGINTILEVYILLIFILFYPYFVISYAV